MDNRYLKRTDSKNPLRFFGWTKGQASVYPNFSFDAVIKAINNDPVARGAVTHFIDKCMEGNYSLIRADTYDYDFNFEKRLNYDHQFRTEILYKVFLQLKLFNNAFIEIVKDSKGHTKELNVLDSSNVDPKIKANGDPIKYVSKTPSPETGAYPEWTKDEIVWIKFGDRSVGYAPVDIGSLWETLLAKEYVTRYVSWLWKTGQYRVLYNFENASDQDVLDFLAYARKNDNNFSAPFVTKGKVETKVLRDMKETESYINLLNWYDSQILILLRVPPVDAGLPDNSGRSNADVQTNNFVTSVQSMKKIVEDKINYDLFPKINKGNNLLKFGATDRFTEKMLFQNVQIMQSVGFSPDAMKEYLEDRGVFFRTNQTFNQVDTPDGDNPKDKDKYISRQRGAEMEGNENQDEVTTREDQLHKEE
jgi:hypothetical protein